VLPVSMICPANVKRSTMAAQSRGSVKVFVQERQIAGQRDTGAFLAFGHDLEEQFGSARVNLDVAQLLSQQSGTFASFHGTTKLGHRVVVGRTSPSS
jgi:aminopeptidase-like protein